MAWQDREREWKNLNEMQRQIGCVSMAWSQIDLALIELIANLTDLAPGQATIFLKGKMIGAKIEITRDLIKFHAPSGDWSDRAKQALVTLTQDLNPKRNRIIHDIHRFDVDEISRQKVDSIAADFEPDSTKVTIAEMEQLWHQALVIIDELRALAHDVVPWAIEQRNSLSYD